MRERSWDWVAVSLLLPSFMAIFPVAAMYHGSPLWVTALGYVLLAVGMVGMVWVEAVNKFAEPSVRIQTERGHTVVDTGPYAIVRHPMYVAAFPLFAGIALALGSYWALIPVAVATTVLIRASAH